jgi:single-strand DNA-binding protein
MVSQQPNSNFGKGTSGLNKVMIIGNLGADPEMRFTPGGSPVTTFNVAVSRVYSPPEGERKVETEWFSVVTWTKLAETCNQYLTKGQKIYCEGRLHTRSWDGQDGQKHYKTEVIAERVIFLDKKQTSARSGEKLEDQGETGEIEPSDLPF